MNKEYELETHQVGNKNDQRNMKTCLILIVINESQNINNEIPH